MLSINNYQDVGNPLTLSSTRMLNIPSQLAKIVGEAVRQQSETGYPQAIILSGSVGSYIKVFKKIKNHIKNPLEFENITLEKKFKFLSNGF